MTDATVLPLLAGDFLRVSRHRIDTRRQRIEACLARLTDEQIRTRRHDAENAVGNLGRQLGFYDYLDDADLTGRMP